MSELIASPQESEPGRDARAARPRKARGLGQDVRAALHQAVEHAVIPALTASPRPQKETGPRRIGPRDLAKAVAHALGTDDAALGGLVATLRAGGAAPDAIYAQLLTPVARRVGDMWVRDECTFADVTLAVLRMQAIQRELSPLFREAARPGGAARRILLMPVPGEQHVFGLTMVADHFTRDGWDARIAAPANTRAARKLVRESAPDVLGLSLGSDDRLADAAGLVAELKRDVPGLRVLAGGPSVLANPTLPAAIGADAGTSDAHEAVLLARSLLDGAADG